MEIHSRGLRPSGDSFFLEVGKRRGLRPSVRVRFQNGRLMHMSRGGETGAQEREAHKHRLAHDDRCVKPSVGENKRKTNDARAEGEGGDTGIVARPLIIDFVLSMRGPRPSIANRRKSHLGRLHLRRQAQALQTSAVNGGAGELGARRGRKLGVLFWLGAGAVIGR